MINLDTLLVIKNYIIDNVDCIVYVYTENW